MKLRGIKPPPGCDENAIVLSFLVAREFDGQRLDRFVQNRIPRLSRTRAQDIIRNCGFRPDGSKRKPNDIVREGEIVLLVRSSFEEPITPTEFDVVYEDDAVLAVDKPAGLPVHPTATYHRNTLTYLLKERYGAKCPQIAHRLDRETSGVLVCGKTLEDERTLKHAFENRLVQKTYLAITRGEMPNNEGTISLPLAAVTSGLHLMMEVRDEGDTSVAETYFQVVERKGGHTLVSLFPKTGRQHQLRVHLSALGFPIVGDKLYGPEREAPFYEALREGMSDELLGRLGHDRQALHAHSIELKHPRTGERLSITAPLAPDLRKLWDSF